MALENLRGQAGIFFDRLLEDLETKHVQYEGISLTFVHVLF